jgi:hypothetical protein
MTAENDPTSDQRGSDATRDEQSVAEVNRLA